MITPMSQVSTTKVARIVEAMFADERLALIDQLWSSPGDADLPPPSKPNFAATTPDSTPIWPTRALGNRFRPT